MSLAAPERLLDALVHNPDGVTPVDAGFDADAARDELARRGHHIEAVLLARGERGDPAAAATTWRLRCWREHFAPQRFESQRSSRLGAVLEVWEECESTNRVAAQAARGGAPHGALWLTEAQHRGRGRQGRHWHCPAHQGLLFSVLLRPAASPPERAALLPLTMALGVCEGLRAATQCDVRIKWPNDLVLGGAKLGGILVEARLTTPAAIVVGCGLNVRVDTTQLRRDGVVHATSLHAHNARLPRRETLLAHVLSRMQTHYDAWSTKPAAIVESWARFDALRDRQVRVRMAGRQYDGVAAGITAEGALRVRLVDGSTRCFSAGEVHLA